MGRSDGKDGGILIQGIRVRALTAYAAFLVFSSIICTGIRLSWRQRSAGLGQLGRYPQHL